MSCLFFTRAIAFDLRCFAHFSANSRSRICTTSGKTSVTALKFFASATLISGSCSIIPFKTLLKDPLMNGFRFLHQNNSIFFLFKNTQRVFIIAWSNNHFKKIALIFSAKLIVTFSFSAIIPPKAETGSPANARSHDNKIFCVSAQPHALVCLIIAQADCSNSSISFTAASMSTRLL